VFWTNQERSHDDRSCCTCQDRGNRVSSGKSPQVIRLHSAHFSKPVRGGTKMHTVAATTAASGAESERCDAWAQRKWQLSVFIRKTVTLWCDEVRIFSFKTPFKR